MRIPTFNQYEREAGNISREYDQLTKLEHQANSGKKIQHSSEDPVLGSAIKTAENYIASLKSYDNNATNIINHDTFFKASSQNAISLITQVQEIIKKAQTDTASPSDRISYSKALQETLNQLLSIASTQDSNGQYIYSGNNPDVPPFTLVNGQYQYQGGQDALCVNIKPNTPVVYNDVGNNVFGGMFNGNGTFTVTPSNANTGSTIASPGSVINQTDYVADQYTISFVKNGAGELAYQVTGVNSGQVIPQPPAVTPANAPAYQPGSDIIFNGISINIAGEAEVGDVIQVAPSTQENIFNSIQTAINLLQTPVTNSANFTQAMSQSGSAITQAFNYLNAYSTEAGSRSNTNNAQIQNMKEVVSQQTIALSNLENADYNEVLSAYYQQSLALEVTNECYVKMQALLSKIIQMHF